MFSVMEPVQGFLHLVRTTPPPVLVAVLLVSIAVVVCTIYLVLYIVAPIPRPPLPSEKTYTYISIDGATRKHQPLPCWYDKYVAEQEAARTGRKSTHDIRIEPAEVYVSLVVPAYNEEERIGIMLTEAVAYLEQHYGPGNDSLKAAAAAERSHSKSSTKSKIKKLNGTSSDDPSSRSPSPKSVAGSRPTGYEIIIVSDGSTDRTVDTALNFARKQLPIRSRPNMRVISLERNRGKGGAVTHGLRHVRGAYALFADADGATRFSDLGSVLEAARVIEIETAAASNESRDGGNLKGSSPGPISPGTYAAVSIGSRAHMVNTPAVVKRSALRNLLMRGFHIFLRLMTPPRTARIGDTQCGFKLFSRASLPDIVPWMHAERWEFDVEMLMLAESANIDVAECPVGWKEIKGSKLNVIWDSLGMAWGLAVLRGAWLMGVYRRQW